MEVFLITMYSVDFFSKAETIDISETMFETFRKLNRLFNKKNLHKKVLKKTNITVDNLSNIKTIINKITLETYAENCDELIKEYNGFSDKKQCSMKIFEILSKNAFYSSLYASLYSKLIDIDNIFLTVLNDYKVSLTQHYDNIVFYDSNEDYDKFCKNNQINEKIKAITSFYCYLMLNNNISAEYIIENINFLINKIKQTDDNLIIFELLENMNIYISISHNIIMNRADWNSILNDIKQMKDKKNGFSHLKNKCVFKCMDILDFVNKI